jgi:hypothetical protein
MFAQALNRICNQVECSLADEGARMHCLPCIEPPLSLCLACLHRPGVFVVGSSMQQQKALFVVILMWRDACGIAGVRQ